MNTQDAIAAVRGRIDHLNEERRARAYGDDSGAVISVLRQYDDHLRQLWGVREAFDRLAANPDPFGYVGVTVKGETVVFIAQKLTQALSFRPQPEFLPLRLDLANHSPDGFAWGYGGSGPAQLAIALIAHASGNDALARLTYQRFKDAVIAKLPASLDWHLSREDVLREVAQLILVQP